MKINDITSLIEKSHGIRSLNPMQQAMAATDDHEILLLSPTGSGKTLAFTIFLLKNLTKPLGHVQAVILAPSRELVLQIFSVLRPVALGYKVTPLYGGHSMTDEVNSLSPTPDIIVATPGRLLDHIKRQQIDLALASSLVIDEYDKSLELGFADEMAKITRRLTHLRDIVLTSATRLPELPPFIHADNLATLDFSSNTPSPRRRMQVVEVESPDRDKLATLIDLLNSLPNRRTIVFVNHRESAERVHAAVAKADIQAGLYHGGLEQHQRQIALDLLHNGTTPVLVATDLAARGLDIDDIGSVIHYHMPVSKEAWTHRNGRTARQDASGTIYVITTEGESVPDYIKFDRQYHPTGHSDDPLHSDISTLYFNAGRREKISRGDIAGFLIKIGLLPPPSIGLITVTDHYSLAAVPSASVPSLLPLLSAAKLKNQRVKISLMKP